MHSATRRQCPAVLPIRASPAMGRAPPGPASFGMMTMRRPRSGSRATGPDHHQANEVSSDTEICVVAPLRMVGGEPLLSGDSSWVPTSKFVRANGRAHEAGEPLLHCPMLAPGQTTVLRSPPDDGITSLSFAPNSDRLLLSSWDGTVRLYDTRTDSQEQLHETSAPALDASFALDDTKGFVGCVDGKLYLLDFKGNELSLLGSHQKGVKSVEYCNSTGVTVSGGWDRKMKLWDPRSSSPLTASCNIKGKVFNLSVSGYRVVVATSERHVTIYDVRKTDKPEQDRLSSLQHQLRTVRCFPDGTGYAVGSVEGRIAIEYFDPSPAVQAKKYAFKCHRKTDNDGVRCTIRCTICSLRSALFSSPCMFTTHTLTARNRSRRCTQ